MIKTLPSMAQCARMHIGRATVDAYLEAVVGAVTTSSDETDRSAVTDVAAVVVLDFDRRED